MQTPRGVGVGRLDGTKRLAHTRRTEAHGDQEAREYQEGCEHHVAYGYKEDRGVQAQEAGRIGRCALTK